MKPQNSERNQHAARAACDSIDRRRLLGAVGAGAWVATWPRLSPAAANAATTTGTSQEVRLALLLGNRDYPAGQDLPPIPKNLRDLRGALELRGFQVTDALDLSLSEARGKIEAFSRTVRAAPPEATIFFYFSGHGLQDEEARNLLVSARANPKVQAEVDSASLRFGTDVVDPLAPRQVGMTMAVLDTCRVSLSSGLREGEGLNQVEAPPGSLIAFSTGAGKPAIAPALETQNTFYTASLVKLMTTASGDITFADLFRLVRRDVRQTMLSHPVKAVRDLAQDPFIADNTHVAVLLSPRAQADAASSEAAPVATDEESLWSRLQHSVWPAEVASLASEFLEQWPQSRWVQAADVARDGAAEAARLLKRTDLRLYRSAFQPRDDLGTAFSTDLLRAGRGDKDAAARMGRRYRSDEEARGLPGVAEGRRNARYEGWMQLSAGLGNGIASYELALHYRRTGQALLAAQFESRARELGYTPPPSLDHFRK